MSLQEVGTIAELEDAIDTNDSVMVVFSKDQCPACNTMGRWVEDKFIPDESNSTVKVVMAKLEKLGRGVVDSFTLRTMPTTVLFKGGDEVYRVPGFNGPAPIENAINAHLKTA